MWYSIAATIPLSVITCSIELKWIAPLPVLFEVDLINFPITTCLVWSRFVVPCAVGFGFFVRGNRLKLWSLATRRYMRFVQHNCRRLGDVEICECSLDHPREIREYLLRRKFAGQNTTSDLKEETEVVGHHFKHAVCV
jgi:hypothetical protein